MVHNRMRRRWLILVICGPVVLLVAIFLCFYVFEASLWDDRGFKDFCGETEVVQGGLQQFFGNTPQLSRLLDGATANDGSPRR